MVGVAVVTVAVVTVVVAVVVVVVVVVLVVAAAVIVVVAVAAVAIAIDVGAAAVVASVMPAKLQVTSNTHSHEDALKGLAVNLNEVNGEVMWNTTSVDAPNISLVKLWNKHDEEVLQEFRLECSTLQKSSASSHWTIMSSGVRDLRVDTMEHKCWKHLVPVTGVTTMHVLPVKLACLPSAGDETLKSFHELHDAAHKFAGDVDHLLTLAVLLNKTTEMAFFSGLQAKHKVIVSGAEFVFQVMRCWMIGKTAAIEKGSVLVERVVKLRESVEAFKTFNAAMMAAQREAAQIGKKGKGAQQANVSMGFEPAIAECDELAAGADTLLFKQWSPDVSNYMRTIAKALDKFRGADGFQDMLVNKLDAKELRKAICDNAAVDTVIESSAEATQLLGVDGGRKRKPSQRSPFPIVGMQPADLDYGDKRFGQQGQVFFICLLTAWDLVFDEHDHHRCPHRCT